MSIHEHPPSQARRELKEAGWTKGLELAKVARPDGQHFDCATWLHNAREMPKEDFRRAYRISGKIRSPIFIVQSEEASSDDHNGHVYCWYLFTQNAGSQFGRDEAGDFPTGRALEDREQPCWFAILLNPLVCPR